MTDNLLRDILTTISDFEGGAISLADVQTRIEAIAAALDRTYMPLVQELMALDADLEEIQFGMLLEEQRASALPKLHALKQTVLAITGQ